MARIQRRGGSLKMTSGRPKVMGSTGAWSKGDNEAYEEFKRIRREQSEAAVARAITRLRKDRRYREIVRTTPLSSADHVQE